MPTKTYLVIGTGAIGGFYGIKLAAAGHDVHFLARSDYAEVSKAGLSLLSPKGDIKLDKVNVYNSTAAMPKGDVVFVTTKATSNKELRALLTPVLKDSSMVVLMQNGLNGEDYLADFIDNNRIFGGLSFICVHKKGPGVIVHQDYGSIKIGRYNPDGKSTALSPALMEIVEAFEKSGVTATATTDLLQARWEKLCWNIPFSGLTLLLNCDTRAIIMNDNALALARAIIADVAKSAEACGKPIDDSFQQKMIGMTAIMAPYFPSLQLDYDQGKPMEVEAIFGNPLRAAQKHGYPANYIDMLYHALKFLEINT